MPRYRKKPIVVEAILYTARNADDVGMFVNHEMDFAPDSNDLVIHTLEGDMPVTPGDWVIRGLKGEYYPCKPDIFKTTYDPA